MIVKVFIIENFIECFMIICIIWQVIVLASINGKQLTSVWNILVNTDTVLVWNYVIFIPMDQEYRRVYTFHKLICRDFVPDYPLHRKNGHIALCEVIKAVKSRFHNQHAWAIPRCASKHPRESH